MPPVGSRGHADGEYTEDRALVQQVHQVDRGQEYRTEEGQRYTEEQDDDEQALRADEVTDAGSRERTRLGISGPAFNRTGGASGCLRLHGCISSHFDTSSDRKVRGCRRVRRWSSKVRHRPGAESAVAMTS
jgi:hypothetical protein